MVFQEQLIFPFTIGENLALKRTDQIDKERAWFALEQAGLKEVFKEKQIDINTYMTKQIMKNGIELSGGQQQRFLLARALYKNAPILILDEPTAALDPIAENEVYHSYHQYSQKKTAIFISHRLASTRFSDRIVMIENGSILEMGTHKELMEKRELMQKCSRCKAVIIKILLISFSISEKSKLLKNYQRRETKTYGNRFNK